MENKGIVYILSNETLPDIYKIGRCKIGGLKTRIRTLNTANPKPFRPVIAIEVEKARETEKALHTLFSKNKEGGEFYRFEPELVIPLLGLMGKDITNSFEATVNAELTTAQRTAEAAEAARETNKFMTLNNTEFHLRNIAARMVVKNGKFIVLKGSFAKKESAEHLQYGTYRRIFDKRNTLIADGVFVLEADKYKVVSDVEFDHPSTAASVISGNWISRDLWLNSENKSFNAVIGKD